MCLHYTINTSSKRHEFIPLRVAEWHTKIFQTRVIDKGNHRQLVECVISGIPSARVAWFMFVNECQTAQVHVARFPERSVWLLHNGSCDGYAKLQRRPQQMTICCAPDPATSSRTFCRPPSAGDDENQKYQRIIVFGLIPPQPSTTADDDQN